MFPCILDVLISPGWRSVLGIFDSGDDEPMETDERPRKGCAKVMHACVEPASTSRAKRSRIKVEAKGSGREHLPDYN